MNSNSNSNSRRKIVQTNIKVPHKFKNAQYFQLSGWRDSTSQLFLFEYLDFMQYVGIQEGR